MKGEMRIKTKDGAKYCWHSTSKQEFQKTLNKFSKNSIVIVEANGEYHGIPLSSVSEIVWNPKGWEAENGSID